MQTRPIVALCWTSLLQYRVPFYEALRAWLFENDVDLRLVVSESSRELSLRGDGARLDWADYVPIRRINFFGVEWIFQSVGKATATADLVILEQGNRILSNLPFLAVPSRRRTTAMWGHGVSATSRGNIRDRVKAWQARRVGWWFCYAERGRHELVRMGVPDDAISVVRNSTDTRSLRAGIDSVSTEQLDALNSRLGIGSEDLVILTIAGFDAAKDPGYTVDAARALLANRSDLHWIACGGGTGSAEVESAARELSNFHYLGPTFGQDLWACMKRSVLLAQPGKIGLIAVDSLAAGLPLVTIADRPHAPEFEYLSHGENAVVLPGRPSPTTYAKELLRLLGDPLHLKRLGDQGLIDGTDLTVEAMAERFGRGVLAALSR